MSDAPDSKPDYRSTVFLPRTDFPMKAGLPQKEPAILARWEQEKLYQQVRDSRSGREKFILHDGPPYANGNIHVGHAINKTLKDMVVRTQTLLGKDAPYVPGWDCHGLPIEWKIEEQYRKKKLNKDEVPVREFRAECREYAQHWVGVQTEQFKRLGIAGRWDKPYLTMDYKSEATIVAELMKFAETGQLYRGAKPVMWSPVEKTALAEAEIEYEDIVSTQIDLAFEIEVCPGAPELVGAYAVIWTTTPWTIPVNQAIAYALDVEYEVIEWGYPERRYLVASSLKSALIERLSNQLMRDDDADAPDVPAEDHAAMVAAMDDWEAENPPPPPATYKGSALVGAIAKHPMHHLGGFFAEPRPFLPGDFVTTDQGTGLVHMAPDHGEDDFELCREQGIGPVFAVEGDGKYRADWGWLGGQGSVINAKFNSPEGPILTDLAATGQLLSAGDFKHSYPHSWRSKAKVIYRCTPQWFIAMDRPLAHLPALSKAEQRWENEGGDVTIDELPVAGSPSLREVAIDSIAKTRFVPEKGRNRLGSMVEDRPDWVISRQRAWGVPIALFVNRKSGDLLIDAEVNRRIVEAIRDEGVDAWDEANAARFLGEDRDPVDYEMVGDILDVWFDSGSTHVFVLESGEWPELRWPADIYVEGSDQHRGWFQSSLLESSGTRGRAPFDTILTHGFTMDSKGMKMSKSLGNTVDPLKVMETYGADIIRLWALSVDFTEDHRIGDEILKGVSDQYRKLRNTFRYLLGALDGFGEEEWRGDFDAFPDLEKYMLSLLGDLDRELRRAAQDFDFNAYTRAVADFCNNDLSAFYFDIRKDCLYCDAPGDPKRRAYRTMLDLLFHALVRWMAPVLVFTSEEVWSTRFPDEGSVHLLEWPEIPPVEADSARWAELRALRERVTEAIEPLRREKVLGSSLEAEVTLSECPASAEALMELFITSTVHGGDSLGVTKTANHKCGRCWRHLPEVSEDGALCARCEKVVNG